MYSMYPMYFRDEKTDVLASVPVLSMCYQCVINVLSPRDLSHFFQLQITGLYAIDLTLFVCASSSEAEHELTERAREDSATPQPLSVFSIQYTIYNIQYLHYLNFHSTFLNISVFIHLTSHPSTSSEHNTTQQIQYNTIQYNGREFAFPYYFLHPGFTR